jgi:hypothetical protein
MDFFAAAARPTSRLLDACDGRPREMLSRRAHIVAVKIKGMVMELIKTTGEPTVRRRGERSQQSALEPGNAASSSEKVLLTGVTSRIYHFRTRHPWLYAMIAFFVGGGLVAIFTATTYENWSYESIDLTTALYQVVFGGFGGGIVTVILAFAYAAAIRTTIPASN